MVFVKANRALKRRREESTSMDPILLKDIDESNEWLLGRMDGDSDDDTLVFEDDNLTWAAVARASGADEPNYYTRRRTSQGSTTKQGSMSNKDKGKAPASSSRPRGRFQLVDEDEDEDEEEDVADYPEEEEEDIGDDDVGGFDDVDPEHVVLDDDDDV